MRAFVLPIVFALAAPLPAAVHAEPLSALTADGRYQLMEINDKIVRLDTTTGKFDLCHMEADDWTCVTTRDQRTEFENKIAGLTRRIEALETARKSETVAATASQVETVRLPAAAPPASTPAHAPVPGPVVAAPVMPSVAPVAAPAAPKLPSAAAPARSNEFEQVADVVPPGEVGRTPGVPMVIAPAQPKPEKPGVVERITGWIPGIGW
jgi:hypothetical protein